ncbi:MULTISPECIES: TOBE domain-containing protein [unclassified Pseudomonas]|uniref:TOBE domain-containing protein n=1 Tax=unclassified Pseudomonas TaxID=196821 RepID=UPI002447289C|nr:MULTISPECIES: TOBE domain-containing protein [unclassified Pseudomonas]MDH0302525.1 TOBE domain-containing protein [Pseudomonas sp. GD04091]MDH1983756.1 TOBE domain-containing protein [Pseudomonas sp. GD03689]
MKVSARNVFEGSVSDIKPGAVNAEVELTLGGGEKLVAVVTMASLHNLNINVGKQAVALVKAPWVVLMTDAAGYRLSARNSLEGEVVRVGDGAVNAEVVLKLSGGTEVYAIVTREAVQELGLKPGVKATALIKASHIILGAKA